MVLSVNDCRQYISTIMEQIINVLEDNSIAFTIDKSMTEIKIENSDKKTIHKLILSLPIPSPVIYFSLDISQIKENVYIRKKIK